MVQNNDRTALHTACASNRNKYGNLLLELLRVKVIWRYANLMTIYTLNIYVN